MPARFGVASAVDRESAIQELSGKRIAEIVSMPGGVPTAIGSSANGTRSVWPWGSMRVVTPMERSRDEWRFLASQFGLDRIIGRGDAEKEMNGGDPADVGYRVAGV